MSRESKTYSKEEQLNLLREYQESGLSKNAFCRRHEISCVKRSMIHQKKLYLCSQNPKKRIWLIAARKITRTRIRS